LTDGCDDDVNAGEMSDYDDGDLSSPKMIHEEASVVAFVGEASCYFCRRI